MYVLNTTSKGQQETNNNKQKANKQQGIMTTIDTRNFLKWTSIAIQIENPKITKSASIKNAIKELQKEKKMRNYIRVQSIKYQKDNPNITKKDSIKMAIVDWKKM